MVTTLVILSLAEMKMYSTAANPANNSGIHVDLFFSLHTEYRI